MMELDKTVRRNLSLPFKGEAFRRESLPGFYIALSFKVAYAGADRELVLVTARCPSPDGRSSCFASSISESISNYICNAESVMQI